MVVLCYPLSREVMQLGEKIRKQFHATKSQLDWLGEEAARTGLVVADLIRRAIDEYRERKDRERRKTK